GSCNSCVNRHGNYVRSTHQCNVVARPRPGARPHPGARPGVGPAPKIMTTAQLCNRYVKNAAKRANCLRCVKGHNVYDTRGGICTRKHHRARLRVR
ncbi:MAG: hypothetical protein KAI47_10075, partial [Deltaproteobacteria bacterium]|nr:hypothetical protein [Deltaproteobacteria bacterium]